MSEQSSASPQSNWESNWGSNYTGLDFIWSSVNPLEPVSRDLAYDFATEVLATSVTRGRYWCVERLTIWQAFALFCHLDPDVLGPPLPHRLRYLSQVVRYLRPQDALRRFWDKLPHVEAEAAAKALPLLEEGQEPLAGITDARSFRDHLLSIGFEVAPPEGQLFCVLVPENHDRLHEVLRAWTEKWRPRAFLGVEVDPANAEIKALVVPRLRSAFLCQAVARVVRPSNAKPGRRAAS